MEILKMTRTNMVVIQTVENEERNTFDIGKIRVAALPPIAKKDLVAELKSKGFCDGMIHTALQCKLEDLNGYVNVWKYVAYILAVELMERNQNKKVEIMESTNTLTVKFVGFGGGFMEYPCYKDENEKLYFDINDGKNGLDLYTGAYMDEFGDICGEPNQ